MQIAWAWWVTGLILYIPANLMPMLRTFYLGKELDSTIIGGVIELAAHGSYFIAFVVGFASAFIPMAKFFCIALLLLTIKFRWQLNPHNNHLLYEIVEFVGRWSMIDVFVVAILCSLVQLGITVSFLPGTAALCFGASVIFTMLSAQAIDPRLLWDAIKSAEIERRLENE